MRHSTLLALVAILVALAPAADAETRVALVIGIEAYDALPGLNNAVRDARGMAAKLETLGFQTTLSLNATRRDLYRTLDAFEAALRGSDVGLLFYAGHGIQTAEGRNYLIPADARVEREADLRSEGITVNDVLEVMQRAANPLNVVILDACRDNPLPGASRSARRGLSRTESPAVHGLAVLYSAAPGQVALDGPPGEHGVFTGELLKVLDQPGLSLEEVIRRVNRAVRQRTSNTQRPWSLLSLETTFHFNVAEVDPELRRPRGGQCDRELDVEYWRSVRDSVNPADFEAYLSACPHGQFVQLARNRLQASLSPVDRPVPEETPQSVEAALALSREDRRLIQLGLAAAGFESGPADGLLGQVTRSALRRWQASRGELGTGYLNVESAKLLLVGGKRHESEIQAARQAAAEAERLRREQEARQRAQQEAAERAHREAEERSRREAEARRQEEWGVAGNYRGQIFVNDRLVPVTTNLFVRGGKLMGDYVYGKTNKGSLFRARRPSRYQFIFHWREPVGTGDLLITFAPDWQTFSGYWAWTGRNEQYTWTGQRQ